MLARSPMATIVAVLTLGFGIGLSTTVFSVINAVALKPLPVRDAGHVVRLERWFATKRLGNVQYAFSLMEYENLRMQSQAFDSVIGASFPQQMTMALPSHALESVQGQLVSPNYFSDLGVVPTLGRAFGAQGDVTRAAEAVVVLSYPFWHARLNDDREAVGRVIDINSIAHTVIGVAPREFVGTGNPPIVPDFWIPLGMQSRVLPGTDWTSTPSDYRIQILAHLRPGAGRSRATAETAGLMQQFAAGYSSPSDRTTTVTLQTATFFGNTEDPRFIAIAALVMTIVGLVLLIACANLANLLLARAAGRHRELAVRRALGASRGRLIAQLLTESTILGMMGGAVGLGLSLWGTQLLWVAAAQFAGPHSSFITQVGPDVRVFAYTLLLSSATGILFGLSPALESSRASLTAALKNGGGLFGERRSRSSLRNRLIATQVAVSLMLLISTGLLARGFMRSQIAAPGIETRRIYPLGLPRANDSARSLALGKREIEALEALPEVQQVAIVEYTPMEGTWTTEVEPLEADAGAPSVTLANHVSSKYFEALGIPIVGGRTFSPDESTRSAQVAIVSAATARKSWPGQNPIGRRLKLEVVRGSWSEFEVIGVAGDVRTGSLSRIDPAFVYLPTDEKKFNDYRLLLRIDGDPMRAAAAVAATLQRLDGQPRPGFRLRNLEDVAVQPQILMGETFAVSAGILAMTALVLASMGLYGVTSFVVSQRRKEIGIRMALGATSGGVVRVMIEQGMRPVIGGAIVGLIGALGVSWLLHAMLVSPGAPDVLYGGPWFDPVVFVGVTTLSGLVALAACYFPARRAARVDPTVTLRYE